MTMALRINLEVYQILSTSNLILENQNFLMYRSDRNLNDI